MKRWGVVSMESTLTKRMMTRSAEAPWLRREAIVALRDTFHRKAASNASYIVDSQIQGRRKLPWDRQEESQRQVKFR